MFDYELTPRQEAFDYNDLTIDVGRPNLRTPSREIEALRFRAYSDEFHTEGNGIRSESEIETALNAAPDTFDFVQKYGYPSPPSDERFSRQRYGKARIAVARLGAEVVGFAAMADNTSGNQAASYLKMLGDRKRYAWIGDLAVDPGHRGLGIALAMVMGLTDTRDLNQPMSAYTWAEGKNGEAFLKSLGLKPDSDKAGQHVGIKVSAFGEEAGAAVQHRWTAKRVSDVRRVLRSKDILWHILDHNPIKRI